MVFVVLIFTILIFVGSSITFASKEKSKVFPHGYQAAEYIGVFKDNAWASGYMTNKSLPPFYHLLYLA